MKKQELIEAYKSLTGSDKVFGRSVDDLPEEKIAWLYSQAVRFAEKRPEDRAPVTAGSRRADEARKQDNSLGELARGDDTWGGYGQ